MKFKMPERKTHETFYRLDAFRSYFLESEKLLQRAKQEEESRNGPSQLHDCTIVPTFRHSCLVMLYAIFERELLRLVENLEKERGPQVLKYKNLRGSLMEQVAKFLEVFFGLRINSSPNHPALCDLQKIRNCIVHCCGEVDLVTNKNERDYLLRLKDSRIGFFAWEGGSLTFSVGVLRDPPSFAAKLKQPVDAVSTYVRGRFSDATRQALAGWSSQGPISEPIIKAVVTDLNTIIQGELIHNTAHFVGVSLRPQTSQLLAQNPSGEDLARLNRLLLEDAYPLELSRNWDGIPIQIEKVCIDQFGKEVWKFFEWAFGTLNWMIDDCWQKNNWA